jgi:hypothetical protein
MKEYNITSRAAAKIIKQIIGSPGIDNPTLEITLELPLRTIQRQTKALEQEGLIINKNPKRSPCQWHWYSESPS